jgi:hypothetical protein
MIAVFINVADKLTDRLLILPKQMVTEPLEQALCTMLMHPFDQLGEAGRKRLFRQ